MVHDNNNFSLTNWKPIIKFKIFNASGLRSPRMKIDIKMIYINVDYNFNKLSNDIETTTKFMLFRLHGVYWYRFNLDIFTLLATKK